MKKVEIYKSPERKTPPGAWESVLSTGVVVFGFIILVAVALSVSGLWPRVCNLVHDLQATP